MIGALTKGRKNLAVLVTVQILSLIIGLSAIGTAIYLQNQSRKGARQDSCHLLIGLVNAATSHAPKAQAAANAYIHRTPLRNCHVYAFGR